MRIVNKNDVPLHLITFNQLNDTIIKQAGAIEYCSCDISGFRDRLL